MKSRRLIDWDSEPEAKLTQKLKLSTRMTISGLRCVVKAELTSGLIYCQVNSAIHTTQFSAQITPSAYPRFVDIQKELTRLYFCRNQQNKLQLLVRGAEETD